MPEGPLAHARAENDEILSELGYSEAEIGSLRAAAIIT